MVVPLAQGFAAQSVHRQVGRPVCVADVTLSAVYIMDKKVPMNFWPQGVGAKAATSDMKRLASKGPCCPQKSR
jgi:hypothetical protein